MRFAKQFRFEIALNTQVKNPSNALPDQRIQVRLVNGMSLLKRGFEDSEHRRWQDAAFPAAAATAADNYPGSL